MRLSIRHTTRYNFADPVVHALQRLRLTPKTTHGQKILSWDMEFENAKLELEYDDQHFNHVTLVSVEPGATEVVIRCTGLVETQDGSDMIGQHSGHLPLWSFLSQTHLTKPGPQVNQMLRSLQDDPEVGLALLNALSARILEHVEYRIKPTDVETTAEEAWVRGVGTCQDQAHIFIGAARAMDVPARYVSGYLMIDDKKDQKATHAWAEAHIDGMGWVGFDVSRGTSPDGRYVRVATGFDYGDAAPITGISFDSSSQELHVEVAAEQQQVQQ